MPHSTARAAAILVGACLGAALLPAAGGVAQGATPLCFGQPATIVGTAGNDTLVGRADVADVIYGGGGNDRISGGDFYDAGTAPDLLCGGPGADDISGSPGNDKVNGGDGNDVVEGGNGADLVQGNAGDDRVDRGSFADADSKNDTLRGGGGNDILVAGWGADKAYGQGGNDQLIDSECVGATVLVGGPGSDYFESYWSSFDGTACGSTGSADRLDGGDGTDTAKATRNDTRVSIEKVTFPTT